MSRIGKKLITLPTGVKVDVSSGAVHLFGPKGELVVNLPPKVEAKLENDVLTFTVVNPADARQRAFWGLARSLVANAVVGVSEGFSKKLEINGIGYKVTQKEDDLILNLGFSHPIEFKAPAGIILMAEGNIITIAGIDKQLVGEIAAQIRRLRPPEPYKGKGIKYIGEIIRRKAGKVTKGATV